MDTDIWMRKNGTKNRSDNGERSSQSNLCRQDCRNGVIDNVLNLTPIFNFQRIRYRVIEAVKPSFILIYQEDFNFSVDVILEGREAWMDPAQAGRSLNGDRSMV